ncbi:MAG: class I SAM-dependent methyltransferase [Oscillospiraceae bacterium]
MFSEWSAIDIVHKMLKARIKPGDFCIDATAGNGHDTVFLCELVGSGGKVLAMDIQQSAVDSTRENLAEHGFSELAEVICMSHSEMDRLAAHESADCVVFNFGWLPGGDHDIFTRAETSVPAIEKAIDILKPGGLLSLCLYYGRNNGYSERDAILEYLAGLDSRRYAVMKCDFLNRKNDPPFPIFVVKEKM